jgi:predicted O-methyltransferase YrrM
MSYQNPTHIVSSYTDNNIGSTLYDIVKKNKPKKIVEFGVLYGYSTVCMAQAIKDNGIGHIEAYDLFEEYKYKNGRKDVVEHNLKFYNLSDFVTLNKGNFYEWIENPTEFDLLHFDISNDGDIIELVKSKLSKKIEEGSIVIFEGGSENRDKVEWMVKYNKNKMYPLKDKLNYTILRNEHPGLSQFM